MAHDPRWTATTLKEVATFFQVRVDTVKGWTWLEDARVEVGGKLVVDLSMAQQIRYKRLEDAPQSRRVQRESGSAVTYQDKKDREQAWKLRYERLEVQQKYVAKVYVQKALRRWALAFPGPLKELVAFTVSMVPGSQKAKVKKEGLDAIVRCMSKVRDLATAFDINVDELLTSDREIPTGKRSTTNRKKKTVV